MTPEPDIHNTATPPAQRPAVWPWLLLPLVALTLYYVLSTVKRSPIGDPLPAHHAEAPANSTPSDDLESR